MKVRDIVREDAKITKSDGSGVEITADDGVKTTLPADKAAAIMPDPEKPGEYDFNPQAVAQPASGQPEGPKVGSNVEIKTAEDAEADENPNDTPQQIMDKAFASTPELKQHIVIDSEGDIDFSETFANAAETFSNIIPQLVEMFEKIVAMSEQWMASPEFATECDDPEKLAQDIADLKQQLASLKAQVPQMQKDLQAGAADLRSIPKAQVKQQMGAIKGPDTARLQELAGLIAEEITDLGNGAQKKTNPDGTYEIGDGTGLKLYSADGKLIKVKSPTFAGFSQETDVATGNVTKNYSQGPLSTSQTTDKAGKVISHNSTADLGMGVLGYGKDQKGITTKSWAPRSSDMDPITQKDLYAVGNKDKEDTYNRAMAQVNGAPVSESAELTAMLKIAGLR